ncbi:MAG TPA: hypothetical protein VLS25_00840, partial [Dehalococcoidia bacterium]|nr:hypothetical protein [Dehalococcoidia bacterium]
DQAKEAVQQTIENNNYEEMEGIGERAYTDPLYDVSALQGKYEVSVNLISGLGKDAGLQAAKGLTLKALERLP